MTMPPSVNAVATEKTLDVQAGEIAYLFYNATDVGGSFPKQVSFQFSNSSNQSITLEDRDNDGVATYTVASDKPNGTYTLNDISIRDGRAQENRLALNNQGEQNQYGGDGSHTGNLTHGFNFADYTINITGARDPQTDFSAPTLNSIVLPSDTYEAGSIGL